MNELEIVDIERRAMKQWGFEAQLLMLVEEFSELVVILSHYRRAFKNASTEEIVSELADTQIVLDEFKIYMSDTMGEWQFTEMFCRIKQEKLERLEQRLISDGG